MELNPEFFNVDIETHEVNRVGDDEFICPICGCHYVMRYFVQGAYERIKTTFLDNGNPNVAHSFGLKVKRPE